LKDGLPLQFCVISRIIHEVTISKCEKFDSCSLLPFFYYYSLNESGKIRRTVQLGIEKIRAVDQRHGLQAQLLIYLANAFGSKVSGSCLMYTCFFVIVIIPIAFVTAMIEKRLES